jgi:hypothetical protein
MIRPNLAAKKRCRSGEKSSLEMGRVRDRTGNAVGTNSSVSCALAAVASPFRSAFSVPYERRLVVTYDDIAHRDFYKIAWLLTRLPAATGDPAQLLLRQLDLGVVGCRGRLVAQ